MPSNTCKWCSKPRFYAGLVILLGAMVLLFFGSSADVALQDYGKRKEDVEKKKPEKPAQIPDWMANLAVVGIVLTVVFGCLHAVHPRALYSGLALFGLIVVSWVSYRSQPYVRSQAAKPHA